MELLLRIASLGMFLTFGKNCVDVLTLIIPCSLKNPLLTDMMQLYFMLNRLDYVSRYLESIC